MNPAAGIIPAADDGVAAACGPNNGRIDCDLLTDSTVIVDYRVRTVSIDATANDSVGAVVDIVSPADKNPSTARHDIDLAAGQATEIEVMVAAEDTSVTKAYTASVYRRNLNPSDDATLSSLMLSGVTLMYKDDDDMDMTGFMSDVMAYTGDAASEEIIVTAMASHLAAQYGITVTYAGNVTPMMGDDGGYEIPLGDVDDETTITVQVRPESVDATAITAANNCVVADADNMDDDIECYTVTVTRAEEAATLLSMYDADGDGRINKAEAITAINDYLFNRTITKDQAIEVINLYLFP